MPDCAADHQHRTGLLRREILQVGFCGAMSFLGRGVEASSVAAHTGGPGGKAQAVVLVWMPGGPPQMQFWDPKPDSPVECRGTAKPIETSASGVRIGHRLPLIAQQAHRFAVVRSLTLGSEDNDNHIQGDQKVLSGYYGPIANFKPFAHRQELPSMGSIVTGLKPNTNGLPTAVHIPYRVRFTGQGVVGESAGYLGSRYDPWLTEGDPNLPDYRVPDLLPIPGLTVDRVAARQRLLSGVDSARRDLDADLGARQLTDAQKRAFSIVTSPATRRAFDLHQEATPLRDRYGRHIWGQSLLLARRLVQSGVRFVQVNLGDHVNYWDYHNAEDAGMNQHCPPFDRALSAFFEDMGQQGLLDQTLVLVLSEMGRNPVLGKTVTGAAVNAAQLDGRNHWQWCWSGLIAGGGVRGGVVHGASDEWAGYVHEDPVFPNDIGATLYHAMGINPRAELRDIQDRPFVINDGQVLSGLFG